MWQQLQVIKFYLDGEYKKDITNGGISYNLKSGLKAGQTYKFGVSAVNKAGESDISEISVTVPSKETETTGSEETTETLDPSTIKDWTEVKDSKNTMLYLISQIKHQIKCQLNRKCTVTIFMRHLR